MTRSWSPLRSLLAPSLLACVLALCTAAGAARSELLSEAGSFGPDTLTHDTASGLRWLDLTLTTGRSYAQTRAELAGGELAGYRLATEAELFELWEHAGIDLGATSVFALQNHDPVLALATLLGGPFTAYAGSCGPGCTFSFTQGWIDNGEPAPPMLKVASLAWYDNSALLSQNDPQGPVGRAGVGLTTDSATGSIGAWLVAVPEPAEASAPAAVLSLAALALSRSARSARRRPEARRR